MQSRRLAVAWLIIVIIAASVAAYWFYADSVRKTRGETDRWVIIEDSNGDRMLVELTSDQVWTELVDLQRNQTQRYIGGIVERHDSLWGFRFAPDSVNVAKVVAEQLQATIKLISADVDEWAERAQEHAWHLARTQRARYIYINAKVVETHSAS